MKKPFFAFVAIALMVMNLPIFAAETPFNDVKNNGVEIPDIKPIQKPEKEWSSKAEDVRFINNDVPNSMQMKIGHLKVENIKKENKWFLFDSLSCSKPCEVTVEKGIVEAKSASEVVNVILGQSAALDEFGDNLFVCEAASNCTVGTIKETTKPK